jgi:response regulator of citrate/malate metabolism
MQDESATRHQQSAGDTAIASASGVVRARRAPPQRLSSVATSLRLLKCFSEDEAELGVTTLARKLGVAKSTVYRLVSTLVSEGMLEQNRETENTAWASPSSASARWCANA